MKYMLLIYADEKGWAALSPAESQAQMAAYQAYTDSLKQAGVYVGGDPLQPTSSATTVRAQNGKTSVLDGPFAETKEQLGGYYLIDVPDADKAIEWASKCPGARDGSLEVRPILVLP